MFRYALLLLLGGALASAGTPREATVANHTCSATVDERGVVRVTLTDVPGETVHLALTPSFAGHRTCTATVAPGRNTLAVALAAGSDTAAVEVPLLPGGCRLSVPQATGGWRGFAGTVSGSESPLYAARVALDAKGEPTVHGGGDVLDIAIGRASNRRMNAVYATRTFRGALIDAGPDTVDLQPTEDGYRFRFAAGRLDLRALDVWPLLGWRPAYGGSTYGHPETGQPHIIPREWMAKHRPFPWPTLSPVQLPFISITDPQDFGRVKDQVDFLAANLRDWGFSCFGEWPLTQHNPEYAPPAARDAYLAGNRRTCDYAHTKGIRILRWVTDPDLGPEAYPELHAEFLKRGWFSHEPGSDEWLLDYTNPEVQQWIEKQYADLAATEPDFYWIDNNHPTRPLHDPTRFPPDAFREFYLAIQRGLLSTGRNDILMRSGASEWADYSAAGILDVYAPGPDVQNDWTEQQLFVAGALAREDYLCHFNLWRRGIDDFFPAGPQTLDQTHAMATLLGLTGIGFTTTDIGFPKIPPDRLHLLRQLVPIAVTRPMDLYRFSSGALPHWWVLNQQDGERLWQIAGLFNWGLKTEETHLLPLDQLGLDPEAEYLVFDFWSQRPVGRFRGSLGFRVAPTSGRALAIHPVGDRPFIVGTDRHVTMGGADLANPNWEGSSRQLTVNLTAGVAGQTFTLTFFSPPSLRPAEATVEGKSQPIEALGDGLYRMPIPCSGPVVAARVVFTPANPSVTASRGAPRPPAAITDLADRAVRRDLARPGGTAKLLAEARQGKAVILISPREWSPELVRLEDALGLAWGLFRAPKAEAPWMLSVGGGEDEAGEGLLFRSTCIAFQPNTAAALARRVGKGLIAVVRPDDGSQAWRDLVERLTKDPRAALARAETEQKAATAAATSTVGPFEVNAERTEGTAPLRISKALSERTLSFHFRRVSPSLVPDYWSVPKVSISVNSVACPHNYNPCRPESPPQEWDSLYFALPLKALRFDGTDKVTIRSAVAAKDADSLRSDLREGLELAIEDAAVATETQLVSPPEVALASSAILDALLGLDGGVRFLARSGGADVTLEGGSPFNGWPARSPGVTHCVFDGRTFTVVIHVPRGSGGVVEAYAYDYEGVRTEEIVFEGGTPVTVEHFAAGKWLRFPFGPGQSADGELRLTVQNPRGGNAVLSRVRVRFDEDAE